MRWEQGWEGSEKETQGRFRAMAVLLRNTTWKCGRVERLAVEYLGGCLRRYGTPRSSVREMVQHFQLKGKDV